MCVICILIFFFWCLFEVVLNEYVEEEGIMVDKDIMIEFLGLILVILIESISVFMGELFVIVFVVGVVLNDGEFFNKI